MLVARANLALGGVVLAVEHGDGMNERRALERKLAEAERARLSAVEQLRETQIELGQANARARQATLHVEQLVSGMRLLSESREVDALFSGILQVLRDVVGFEEALILSFPEERPAEVVATTTPRLRDLAWTRDRLTERVLRGETVALFDISAKPEWSSIDPEARHGFVSGLHVPLRTDTSGAMLICLHGERGFFTRERRLLAQRFAGLASQALRDAQYAAALETEVAERSAALDRLERAQEQLIQAEKLASLGLLVAGIAHELKNPLNFVNNFAELSSELVGELCVSLEGCDRCRVSTEVAVEELRGNLDRIHSHGRRADAIINAMLMHARDEPGERVVTDINALIRDHAALAYQGVRAEDRRFRADLRFELDGSLPKAKLPYSDLARVIVNVVNNACYATRERSVREPDGFIPEIVVSSRRDGESVVVSVRDNGGGIPPALQRRVFDPFFTTKPPGDGTGLGLSMSYDIIVNQLGGVMRIDSVVDVHTALVFRIPLADAMGPEGGAGSEDRFE